MYMVRLVRAAEPILWLDALESTCPPCSWLLVSNASISGHMTVHLLSSWALAGFTCNATRAASVNASLTPRFLIAEHSAETASVYCAGEISIAPKYVPRYRNAPILLAISRPSLYWMTDFGGALLSGSSSFSWSSLRSHFNAHRTILTPWQCSAISAIHFVETFSSEPRLST